MAINVTANYRLIRSLDPLLRASDAGRAIFVTSGAAHKCTAYWGVYSVSKAALEALVRTYAAETVTTPVKAMLLNPGPLRTAMRRAAMPGEDPLTLKTPEDLAPHIVKLAPALLDRDRQDLRLPAGRQGPRRRRGRLAEASRAEAPVRRGAWASGYFRPLSNGFLPIRSDDADRRAGQLEGFAQAVDEIAGVGSSAGRRAGCRRRRNAAGAPSPASCSGS